MSKRLNPLWSVVVAAFLVGGFIPKVVWAGDEFVESIGITQVPVPAVCYAPTDERNLGTKEDRQSFWSAFPHSISSESGLKFQFSMDDRWSRTATDGSGLSQGQPITLTWSVVPDGTAISSGYGEPAAPSDLRAYLNGIYGSMNDWLPLFEQMFERWSQVSGITYVYLSVDDGAALPTSSGQVGVRADVRIGGHYIDGSPSLNVLAYNYYPDWGDMVVDTGDSYFLNTSSNSLRLRNTIAHEHGHGLGLDHVCPMNETKLMEPMITLVFDGPQHDDILAVNRGYGDRFEHNENAGSAETFGQVGSLTASNLSVDSNSDVDVFSLSVEAGTQLDVTVTPTGLTYLSGPQNANGTCSSGSNYNSLTIQDLAVRVLASNGSSELASVDAHGVGQPETLAAVALASAGTYYVEVTGDASDAAQLYQLSLTVSPSDQVFTDGFESSTTGQWSSTVQ